MSTFDTFLKWFSNNSSFSGYGEYFNSDEPFEISMVSLLNLERKNLKPFTKDAIDALENVDTYKELKAGIRAYFQFQDILDLSLTIENIDSITKENTRLWNRHYCYYESLIYLKESVTSWLDKNILAGIILLRPFLELSLLHLYWDNRILLCYFECTNRGEEEIILRRDVKG